MRIVTTATIENAYWTAIAALLDAGATGGKLQIFSGACPARGTVSGGGNNKIAEFLLPKPCAANIANGILTLNAIPYAVVLTNDTISYAAGIDSNGNWCCHLDCGLSGAAWNWNSLTYTPGGLIIPDTLTLRFPA